MAEVATTAKRIIGNVETVIVGKRSQIVLSLVSWFCEGHILLEDVPGVAKTMLARALAASVGCSFKRIQCTPDLLPTDVTGASIFNPKTTDFEFRAGPIFGQIVLADEINRTTPRTQAALLEAMGESRVTVDGTTHVLEKPFLVIGTQNPVDHEGTFPLPEAQLDRFLVRFSLGYPTLDQELKMLEMLEHAHPLDKLQSVVTAAEIVACQQAVREVHVDDKVRRYLMQIVHATREHEELSLGGSPRASSGPVSHGAGDGGHPRPKLRAARRRQASGPGRADPSPDRAAREPAAQGDGTERGRGNPERDSGSDPGDRDACVMKWFAGAVLLLVFALVFKLGLLAYAMYALLGVMLVSRFLARTWSEHLDAKRECNRLTANVGEDVAVVITVEHRGRLPVAWLLVEDLLPRHALIYSPPSLQVMGRRLQLAMFTRGGRKTMFYQLRCHRRGYYQIGPLVIETGDVFGLHRRYHVATEPHFLLVYPEVRPLRGL